jgi:TonB family protein
MKSYHFFNIPVVFAIVVCMQSCATPPKDEAIGGAGMLGGTASPSAAVQSAPIRSDVLYLPDTPGAHQKAAKIEEVLRFRQQVVFRNLDTSHIQHLVPVRKIPPRYPSSLASKGVAGSVTVTFIVDDKGEVSEAAVEASTHPDFVTPALQMIQQWRFQPATYDGIPIRSIVTLPVEFFPK